MKPRGNTKIILEKVGKVQDLIGLAIGNHDNDRDLKGFETAQKQLREAFELCIEIRNMYDPIW